LTLSDAGAGESSGTITGRLVPVTRPALSGEIAQTLYRDGIVVVQGGIGVGKTYLIEQEVRLAVSHHFPGAATWLPSQIGPLRQQLTEFTQDIVSALPYPRLLVLDGVEGPEDLPDTLLNCGAQLIIVSRAAPGRWRRLAQTVVVGPFNREGSVRFLTANLQAVSSDEAGRLAEHLGDLALALVHAIPCFEPGVTVDAFLERVKTHALAIFSRDRPSGYQSSLAAEIGRTLDALPHNQQLSLRIALGALALMGGGPFPFTVLSAKPELLGWRSTLNDLASDRRVPLHHLSGALRALEHHGFLSVTDNDTQLSWLTSQLVRILLSPTEQERAAFLAEAMLLSRVPASGGIARWEDWPIWEAGAKSLLTIDPRCVTTDPGQYALLAVCHVLLEQGRANEAHERLLALRSCWRRTQDAPLKVRLRVYDLLAQASYLLDDKAAAYRYSTTVFRVRLNSPGLHHADTIASAAHRALVSCRTDDLLELVRLAEDIPDRRLSLRVASFIALLRSQSSHDPGPVDMVEEILRDQRDILGPGHPHTLFTAGLLATALSRSGEALRGLTLRKETLELQTKTLGSSHPDTMATADALHTQRRELGL
jgi:hypothetical protein